MSYSLGKYPFGYRHEWPVVIQTRKRPSLGATILLFFMTMMVSLLLFVAGIFILSGCAGERVTHKGVEELSERPEESSTPEVPGLPEPTPRPQSLLMLIPPPVQAPPPPAVPPRHWRVPRWIVAGILATETKSHLRSDDTVHYVDKTRGSLGERGPTQLRQCAFDQVKRPGEAYWRVEIDIEFALDITERYLLWLKRHTGGSWREAIQAYNAGLGNRNCSAAHEYYASVKENGSERQ